jgi:hypothetical protein
MESQYCVILIIKSEALNSFLVAFLLFVAEICLFGAMAPYYNGVINDNRLLNDHPMFQMLQESKLFMKNVNDNVCGYQLLKNYHWLKNFDILIRNECHIMPDNLRYLRYTDYASAIYNTFLMHILLSGILPVSLIASVPIITSFASGYINASQIITLGLFEFSQIVLSLAIMITFIVLKEKRIKSQLAVEKDSHKSV